MKYEIILTELEDKDLEKIEKTGALTIPKGVTKIGKSACWGLKYLSELIIPEGVKFIEEEAFADCAFLSKVTFPKSVNTIFYNAFRGCDALKEVYVHGTSEECLRAYKGLFKGDTKITLIKDNSIKKEKSDN